MSPRYDVFLSHSSPDKPAVEELARRLRGEGIEPFLDKWHLIPGQLWQPALEKGLRESRTCAIFVGSEGLGPWQTQEMLVALDRGARDSEFVVFPVLLPGYRKPSEIPAFLMQRTWVELPSLDDEWVFHCLVCAIRGEAPGPRPGRGVERSSHPYRSMAQPPEAFVHRREYDEVLAALCPVSRVNRPPSVGITTALRGAGGFGKTDLAKAICQDPRIHQTYPDGTLWATMGEDIDANGRLARVRDLIRWWTEEKENPTFENVSAAASRLRELLAGRRVMIVVDDVWSPADVIPLQGMGAESALLVTTRDRQCLPLESVRIDVDAMAQGEAVSLLRSGLSAGNPVAFGVLARRLGEWPLLLKIVNRQIRELVQAESLSPDEALREVEEALDAQGLTAFDREDQEERSQAVSSTLNTSLKRLSAAERERFGELAIFPEDADVPLSALQYLWGLDRTKAKALCARLHDLSLLLDFDRRAGTVRLHDVIRQFLIRQRQEDLPALHSRLLAACPSWRNLPREEGYLWRHLADHLLGAGRREELRELLLDPSYLQAKLEATDVDALLADYEPFVGERDFRWIRDALKLSEHVLGRDGRQLVSQLYGRLAGLDSPAVRRLLQEPSARLRLRPRHANLTWPGGPLSRVLIGHAGSVSSMAAVDGRRVVSADRAGVLRVWDVESGEVLRVFEGHTAGVNAVSVVDSRRVVSGSASGKLLVWDLEMGKVLRILDGHREWVSGVSVVDGRRVVSCSGDGTLRVWDLETSETLRVLHGRSGALGAVAAVDARRAVSGSKEGTLEVWDLDSGELLRTLAGHSDWVRAVSVIEGRYVVSGSLDKTLRVWDLESGEALRILRGHTGGVDAVAVDGGRAISGDRDGTLRLWDLATGETLRTLQGHSFVQSVLVLGSRAVSGSSDGELRVWDLNATAGPPMTSKGHVSEVKGVVVEGQRVVSGSSDRTLKVWDLESGETLRTLHGHSTQVTAVAVVDDRRVVSGAADGTLRVWDLESGETLRAFEGASSGIFALTVDGCRAVSGSNDASFQFWGLEYDESLPTLAGTWVGVSAVDEPGFTSTTDLRFWNLETGETLSSLGPLVGEFRAVALHPRDFHTGNHLRVWDLETRKTLRVLKGHSDSISSVATVDGRRAISGSVDGTVRLWDLESGECLRVLEGHASAVTTLSVVGCWVATGQDDGTLRVWRLDTGHEVALTVLDAPVSALALAADQRVVVAGDKAGRIHFFDLLDVPSPAVTGIETFSRRPGSRS